MSHGVPLAIPPTRLALMMKPFFSHKLLHEGNAQTLRHADCATIQVTINARVTDHQYYTVARHEVSACLICVTNHRYSYLPITDVAQLQFPTTVEQLAVFRGPAWYRKAAMIANLRSGDYDDLMAIGEALEKLSKLSGGDLMQRHWPQLVYPIFRLAEGLSYKIDAVHLLAKYITGITAVRPTSVAPDEAANIQSGRCETEQ